MARYWEDTFVVIDKIRAGKPSRLAASAVEKFKQRIAGYVCHSTRAYRVGNTIYVATTITFRRSEVVPLLFLKPQFRKMVRSMGLDGFGTGPKLRKKTPIVMYLIYDESQLYLGAQQETGKTERFHGEPLLVLEEKYFKFEEICSPVTRALAGIGADLFCPLSLPDNIPNTRLLLDFIQPEWLTQGESSRIVAPETNIADFTRLSLAFRRPQAGNLKTTITVFHIHVILQEIYWIAGRKAAIPRSKDSEVFGRNLQVNYLDWKFEINFMSDIESIVIPRRFYDCKLPDLGPSFFSNRLLRGYRLCIRTQFTFEGAHPQSYVVSNVMEISVARKVSVSPKTLASLCQLLPRNLSATPLSFIVVERFPRSSEGIREIARQAFRDISSDNLIDYLSHETNTVTVEDDVLAVSKINVSQNSHLAKSSKLNFNPLKSLTFGGDQGPGQIFGKDYSVWEAKPWSDQDDQFTTKLCEVLFQELKGQKVKYPYPFSSLFFQGNVVQQSSMSFPCFLGAEVSLIALFKACSHQCGGTFSAQPGQKISEFLGLEIVFSGSVVGACSKRDLDLTITRMEVVLRKSKTSIDQLHHFLLGNCHWLYDKACEEDLFWGSFESTPGESLKSFVVPLHLYECHLPEEYPSIDRQFDLCIRMTVFCPALSVKTNHQFQFEVGQRIRIGSLHFEQSEKPVQPPPYLKLIFEKLKLPGS